MPVEITSVPPKRRKLLAAGKTKRVFQSGARAATLRKRRTLLYTFAATAVICLAATLAFLYASYISYSKIVDARLASGYLTSRAGIYAAPRTLRAGQTLPRENLIAMLRRAGYVEQNASDVWSGSFTSESNSVRIRPRRSINQTENSGTISVGFNAKGRIMALTKDDTQSLAAYTLEPETLTNDVSMKTNSRAALAYKDIPATLVRAVLAIEDHRFFEHRGIDIFGIGRALLRNAGENEIGQGGSTITQQLVKNTYLSPEKTYRRKFAEAMLAATLERRLSKEDIFALYANEIYLGQRGSSAVRGVASAARVFFGKELKDLSLAEAATIAGMIQSPTRYAPDRHAEAATTRRNTVLAAMLREGYITSVEAAAAINETLVVAPAQETNDSSAPYFVDYVNRVVESELEANGRRDERNLQIHTTIDPELQQLAEAALKHQLEKLARVYRNRTAKPQASLVALNPKTGDVLAMVGGRSYAESQLNRATDAARQPGSVFKPIVYAAALESGLSPVEMYKDAPREFVYDNNRTYRPANYGGAYSMHDVMMRTALVNSLNVVTVDVALRTGLARIARTAEDFGLARPEPYPALALGTTEATPLQLAAAYASFANGGVRIRPNAIARVTNASGASVIEAREVPGKQLIKPATAYMMTDMLTGVIDRGTARAARSLMKETVLAGKTGTSRDGWFAGYTPNLVCVVWIGFDDNTQLGLTGAEAALPAWMEFVGNAVRMRPELGGAAFERPEGVMHIEVDPETGLRATDSCPQRQRIALTPALAPSLECYTHNPPPTDTTAYATTDVVDESASPSLKIARESKTFALSAPPTLTAPPRIGAHTPSYAKADTPRTNATRVETYGRGRPLLTNEISVDYARTPAKKISQ
ncbi:MAG: penicillin-binding protein 1A [Pyrinomonadaceae bacterium]